MISRPLRLSFRIVQYPRHIKGALHFFIEVQLFIILFGFVEFAAVYLYQGAENFILAI